MESVSDLFKSLTIEPDLKSFRPGTLANCPHRLELNAVLIIWLLSTNFLVLSFQSVLLNNFFDVRSVPLVETLDDIFEDSKFFVVSTSASLDAIRQDESFSSEMIDSFEFRRKIYQRNFDFDFDKKLILLDTIIFKDIVEGNAVLLANSDLARRFSNLYISENNLFSISQTKYFPTFGSFIMLKNQNYHRHIKFM